MSKKTVEVTDYAKEILTALPKGILLTTKAGGKLNTMTIGWGTLGTNWGKPVFAAYVRKSRFTWELLEKNPEFTVNIPLGDFDKKIVGICGSKSGRDEDKVKLTGLTPVESEKVSVPGFRELPLTLECRVMYTQLQDASHYPEAVREAFYPPTVESPKIGTHADEHITVFGEILAAYIIE